MNKYVIPKRFIPSKPAVVKKELEIHIGVQCLINIVLSYGCNHNQLCSMIIKCCICNDLRHTTDGKCLVKKYIDGAGVIECLDVYYQHYCPSCKNICSRSSQRPTFPQ